MATVYGWEHVFKVRSVVGTGKGVVSKYDDNVLVGTLYVAPENDLVQSPTGNVT